jgi:predicted PhzF superfamily epimerase YddE/YHI9
VYVWAPDPEVRAPGAADSPKGTATPSSVVSRFFFLKSGAVAEDPGTGSACANLGGWMIATGAPLPVDLRVRQGEHTGRRCRLGLRVDSEKGIFVTGRVVEIGAGELAI